MTIADFPEKLQFLFEPARFKVAHGGRGGAKSWGYARALLLQGVQRKLRVLCVREFQSSIEESVHKLLSDQISDMGLDGEYLIEKRGLTGRNGTEFFFEGIKANTQKIKSIEGVDICWVEEAALVTKTSWTILEPTIRKPGSEIWVSFNPDLETDETSQKFIEHPTDEMVVVQISWRDNPWFPEVLRKSMETMRERNFDEYLHVWEGEYKVMLEGAIYAEQLRSAMVEKRITHVPYERTVPVDTYWDLGKSDATSIWFIQRVGMQWRVLDFISARQKPLEYFMKAVQDRPYTYGVHYLPHDAKASRLGMRSSIESQVRAVLKAVHVVPVSKVMHGIQAVRDVFPSCWFDRTKCSDGIKALKNYKWTVDEAKGRLSNVPLHDWASDPADAFRTFGVIKGGGPKPESKSEKIIAALRAATHRPISPAHLNADPHGWMGH